MSCGSNNCLIGGDSCGLLLLILLLCITNGNNGGCGCGCGYNNNNCCCYQANKKEGKPLKRGFPSFDEMADKRALFS